MSNRSNFGPFSTAPRLPSRPPLRRARFSDDDASHHRVQAPVSSSRTPSPSQASPSSYRPVAPRAELRPSCEGTPTRPEQTFLALTTRNQEEEQPPLTPRTGGKSSTDDGSPFKANYSLAVPGSPTEPVSSTVTRDISPLDDDGGLRPSMSNTFAAATTTAGRGAANPFAPFMPPAPHMSETLAQQQQQYLQQLHEQHAAQQIRQQPATYGEAITPASFFASTTSPTNVEPLAAALPADTWIRDAKFPFSVVNEDSAPGECSSAPSKWKSVAGRRPTSHLVLINDNEEESIDISARHGPTDSTGNSHKVDQWLNESSLPRSTPEERGYTQPSLLMNKRRSISLGRLSSASGQLQPTPPTPARLASHHLNGSPLNVPRTSSSMGSTCGPLDPPHIIHYDPASSPSMIRPHVPLRIISSGSQRLKTCLRTPPGTPRLSPTRAASSGLQQSQADLDDSCEKGVVIDPIAGVAPAEDGQSYFATAHQLLAGLYRSQNSASLVSSAKEGLPQAQQPRTPRQYPSQSSFGDASTLADTPVKEDFEDTNKVEDKIATPASDPLAKEKLSRRTLANQRRRASMAFTLGMDDEPMEDDDPRVTGKVRKSVQVKREREEMRSLNRRCSWSSEHGDPTVPMRPRRRLSFASVAGRIMRRMSVTADDQEQDEDGRYTKANRDPATKIQYHVAHVLQRQKFILKLARALMLFGAPSHRIESQLNATATVLEVDAQFIHFPGIVIASFGDFDSHTSETHFVKSKTDLALGSLHRVHHVYKKVVHDEMGVEEGAEELTTILHAKPVWSVSSRVLFSFIKCFIMAPLSFGGSIVDACIAGVFGGFLTFLQLHVAGKNQMYSNVFEISMAIIISFVSRGLSSTGVFCYQAIASSGVILVLPGYVVLCGSLELASKNMIAGSVRMVYAIIYSLFLGFGIAIGSDVYFLLDPGARKTMHVPLQTSSQVEGTFTMANATTPLWAGHFTFTNGTTNALNTGSIGCEREPEWPWYQQPLTPWLNFLFVPVFATLACFNLLQPLRSREVPVAVFIACVGWVINRVTKTFIFDRSDVVSAIGSFAIGLLGNLYSRIFKGTAFTAMTPAVLFLVPSGMAMAGGLAMTYKGSDGDLYSNGLSIGLRMIQVSIGITTGLFASCLVVYAFGRKKGAALFAF